jgi:PAS domain S-box-containing protein
VESNQYSSPAGGEDQRTSTWLCPLGLVNNVVPIVIDGKHYGNFITSQFFLEKPDREAFRAQAEKYGFDQDSYLAALDKVPVVDQSWVDRYLFFVTELVGLVSHTGYRTLKEREARALVEETEAQLRLSEEKHRTLFTTMAQGVVYQDADGKIVSANPAAERILGLSLDQLRGLTSIDPRWRAFREDGTDFPGDKHPIPVSLRTGKPVTGLVHSVYQPQRNEHVWIRVSSVPLFRPGESKPYQAYATFDDITDLKKAEAALRESEKLYSTLFTSMREGFALHEIVCNHREEPVDYRFLAVNPAFEALTGLKKEDLLGRTVLEVMPETEPGWIEKYGRVALGGEPFSFESFSGVLERYYHVIAFSPQPRQFAVIFNDITEVKESEEEKARLQEQLAQAQKMESIGKLAGGVAHDYNNQLSGIMGYAELLRARLNDGELIRYVDLILQGARNGARLTRQLLSFARKGQYTSQIIDLDGVVDQVVDILGGTIDKRIEIRWERRVDHPAILADPNQIKNAVLNIALNAGEAIEGSGTVVFETTLVTVDENSDNIFFDLKPGRYVCLTIKDDGRGMEEEVKEQLFDPFFTTKEFGQGSGMGLPAAYGTVKHHGGGIYVDTVPGKGSAFHVLLPCQGPGEETSSAAPPEIKQESPARILVVDDDDLIRGLIIDYLQDQGYSVHGAADGAQGLNYLKANRGRINLVILDLVMPKIGGEELFEALKKIDPEVKVLLSSGYSGEDIRLARLLEGGAPFIHKPYSLTELTAAVEKILGGSRTRGPQAG